MNSRALADTTSLTQISRVSRMITMTQNAKDITLETTPFSILLSTKKVKSRVYTRIRAKRVITVIWAISWKTKFIEEKIRLRALWTRMTLSLRFPERISTIISWSKRQPVTSKRENHKQLLEVVPNLKALSISYKTSKASSWPARRMVQHPPIEISRMILIQRPLVKRNRLLLIR